MKINLLHKNTDKMKFYHYYYQSLMDCLTRLCVIVQYAQLLTPQSRKALQNVKLKKRFNVALSTQKPPQSQSTIEGPTTGIAENKLVITVAPQKLICPQGKT